MAIVTAASLVEVLDHCRLLGPEQLGQVARALQDGFSDARALAHELLQRGWLTPYQINQLFQGRGRDLVLGSYVLLERLGEGGMGQVFKARNWKLDKVVALKLIVKDRVQNAEAVKRFQREIRTAAQLNHPNIVSVHDADQVDGTHFMAMEFVEGIDLDELVQRQGPLPLEQACDCIRQAALGLQHAHERNMIHRDVKPANLMLTHSPGSPSVSLVKLLDLGLVRMSQGPAEGTLGSLTLDSQIVGTPDYMAPEQARDHRLSDHRSDLYSLGGTLFYLLTGRIPFPADSVVEKLFKHNVEPPPTVEWYRPDVPRGLSAVVRKLLAKRPEHRYRSAAEVAVVMARLGKDFRSGPEVSGPASAWVRLTDLRTTVPLRQSGRQVSGWSSVMDPPSKARVRTVLRDSPAKKRWWLLLNLAGVVLLLGGLGLLLLLAARSG